MFRKTISILITACLLINSSYDITAFAQSSLTQSQETLAAPSIFQESSPNEGSEEFRQSVLSDMKRLTVFFSIGFYFLADNRESSTLQRTIRKEFRNDESILEVIEYIDFDNVRRQNNIIHIPYTMAGKGYEARICSREKLEELPKELSQWAISKDWGIQVAEIVSRPENARPIAAKADEPLIGHGFTIDDLERDTLSPFSPWKESEPFRKTVEDLEAIIKDRTNDVLGQELASMLLEGLEMFNAPAEGFRMGIVQSRYDNPDHYYLEYGLPQTIGMGSEFFEEENPLGAYRLEVLFHALFHSTRLRLSEDPERDNIMAHIDAIRLQARLFWDLTEEEARWLPTLSPSDLEKHPANKLGMAVREWRKAKSGIPEAMREDETKRLLTELRSCLEQGSISRFNNFLLACNGIVMANPLWPIEATYPALRAASLLEPAEKEKLSDMMARVRRRDVRNLPVLDSIRLMLSKDVPSDWVSRRIPHLKDRPVWQVSSEIWNAGGGLGRVMQFHGIGMRDLLAKDGVALRHIEPFYHSGLNRFTGNYEELNYASLLRVDESAIKRIESFTVDMGVQKAKAVCYEVENPALGIKQYLIKGFREQDDENGVPYYTQGMYRYRPPGSEDKDLTTLEEFSVFFSLASLELIKRVEAAEKKRPPIMHFNDGQLGLVPYFKRTRYRDDPILKDAITAFTTHTYPNRQHGRLYEGVESPLRQFGISKQDEERYFRHHMDFGDETYVPVWDLTSAGVRTVDWVGAVSAKQVEDLADLKNKKKFKYDHWGDWEDLEMVAVTNGDVRELTAVEFRRIMREACGEDVDIEHPTPEDILKTKRRAKERFNETLARLLAPGLKLDPNLPVLSYTGRGMAEKAGPNRAFLLWNFQKGEETNIEKLVKMGVQVVIGFNVQYEKDIEKNLSLLQYDLAKKKTYDPATYKGNFIFLCNIALSDQRAILAASDVQVQDSDPNTEAAGYSEADISACGGIEIAPPWREGILQAQGIKMDLSAEGQSLGWGNMLTPEPAMKALDIKLTENDLDKLRKPYRDDTGLNKKIGEAYMKTFESIFKLGSTMEETMRILSRYQATSVRLSRVLEARLTAAEYLRQWNRAAANKEDLMRLVEKALEGKGFEPQAQFDVVYKALVGRSSFLAAELKGLSHLAREANPKIIHDAIEARLLLTDEEKEIIRLAFLTKGEGSGPDTESESEARRKIAHIRKGQAGHTLIDTVEDAEEAMPAISNRMQLFPESIIGFNHIAIVTKKAWLEKDEKGGQGREIANRSSPDLTARETLKTRYAAMIQELKASFAGGSDIIGVATQDELIATVNDLVANKGLKVIVLDDGEITEGIQERQAEISGKSGEDYCVVTADLSIEPASAEMKFINLNAMALMGRAILSNNRTLFAEAYKLFTGEEAPPDIMKGGRINWLIKALPRIVPFDINNADDQRLMSKLFRAAA